MQYCKTALRRQRFLLNTLFRLKFLADVEAVEGNDSAMFKDISDEESFSDVSDMKNTRVSESFKIRL